MLAEAKQTLERQPVQLLVVAERAPETGAIRDRCKRYRGRQIEAARLPASVAGHGDEALERLRAVEPAVCEEELVQARQRAPRLVLRPGRDDPFGRDSHVVELAP